MVTQGSKRVSLLWHLGNGIFGAFFTVVAGAAILILVSSAFRVVGLPGSIVSKFDLPILALNCSFWTIVVARRAVKRYQQLVSSTKLLGLDPFLHFTNILAVLVIGFSLSVMATLSIPMLKLGFGKDSLFVILFFFYWISFVPGQTIASIRAVSYIIKPDKGLD